MEVCEYVYSVIFPDSYLGLGLGRCFRFEQIQDGGCRHLGKISNGHISATGRPIHSMFDSRVGFSGTTDLMALFLATTCMASLLDFGDNITSHHIIDDAYDIGARFCMGG